MKLTSIIALYAASLAMPAMAAAAQPSDPVVMNIGGIDVPLSEFMYLYNKNNSQQSAATPVDEYIDMFVNYKLKVRAALDARIDTTAAYRSDMARFTEELARPYMRDKAVDDSLMYLVYDRMLTDVSVSHIMLPLGDTPEQKAAQLALADSIRQVAVNGGRFGELASKFSVDRGSKDNGGKLGVIPVGRLPYSFEEAAYSTPVGGISPVVTTRFGLHIIKVDSSNPDRGEVKVRHILKASANPGAEARKAAFAKADSIYNVLKAGADFATVANAETDDPSGRSNGGDLPWFGAGMMVAPFERAAFSLADGEISHPVETDFGFHIIYREASRPVAPFDELKSNLEQIVMNGPESDMAAQRSIDKFWNRCGASVDAKGLREVRKILDKCGGYNDRARAMMEKSKTPAFRLGKTTVGMADVVAAMGSVDIPSASDALAAYNKTVKSLGDEAVRTEMLATLPDREPDYRNLLNEYSDGLLLYEISNKNVWNRPNEDREGLEAYFLAHRDEFRWDAPRYKGYVVSAVSDSLADAAVSYLRDAQLAEKDLIPELRKQFGTDVKIDKMIVGKGDNAVVDYVGFGQPKPEKSGRWQSFRAYNSKIIDQPEEAMDVRGTVSLAYQQQLEQQWIENLRKNYTVTVDRQVLDKNI